MTRPRERQESAPGMVRVRIAGEVFDAGFVARILRSHPELELVGRPAHCSGGRVYLKFRVSRDETGAKEDR